MRKFAGGVLAPRHASGSLSMSRSIAARLKTAVAQQVLSLVLMVGFAVASARWLGPAGKGMLTVVTSAGFVGASILGLGIPQALTAWVSGDRLSVRDALAMGLAFAGVVAIITGLVTRLPLLASVEAVALLWLSMGLVLFEQVSCGISNGVGDLMPQLLLRIVGGGLQVVVMAAAWLAAVPASLSAALAGYYIPGALGVLLATFMLYRRNPGPRKSARELAATVGPLAAFGMVVMPAQLLSVTNFKLDVLVLGALSGASEVGIYSVAVSATLLVGMLPSAFGQALTRTFGESKDPTPSLKRGIHASLVAGLVSAVVLAGASWLLIPAVFGRAFAPASTLIAIMLPGTALFATVQVSFPYFYNHLKRPIVHSLVIGVTAAVDVGVLIVLAPRYGATGAAVASAFAYLVGSGLNLFVTARASNIPLLELVVPRNEDLVWMARTTRRWLGRERPA